MQVTPSAGAQISYKGNNYPAAKKTKTQEQKPAGAKEPYKSYTGVITKGSIYGLGALLTFGLPALFKSETKEVMQAAKEAGKNHPAVLAAEAALALGTGFIIDRINNKKRSEFAQEIAGKDNKTIAKEHDDASFTSKLNPYQKTSTGKKWGAMLGAVTMPALGMLERAVAKTRIKTGFLGILAGSAIGAVCGLCSGAIIDHFSNKGAAKHADKQAMDANA